MKDPHLVQCPEVQAGEQPVWSRFETGNRDGKPYTVEVCRACAQRVARGERVELRAERRLCRRAGSGDVGKVVTREEWETLPRNERGYQDVSLVLSRDQVLGGRVDGWV